MVEVIEGVMKGEENNSGEEEQGQDEKKLAVKKGDKKTVSSGTENPAPFARCEERTEKRRRREGNREKMKVLEKQKEV